MMSNVIDDLYFGVYEVLGVDTEYVNHPDHYQSDGVGKRRVSQLKI